MYNTLTVLPAWQVLLGPFYQQGVYYSHSFTSIMCTSGSFTSMTCTTLTVYQHDMCCSYGLLPWHVLLWQFYQYDAYYSDSFNSMMCTTLSFTSLTCTTLDSATSMMCTTLPVLPTWHVLLLTVLPAWCVLLCQFYQHDMYYSDSFTSMTCTTPTPTLSLTSVSIIWIIYSSVAAVPDVNSDKDNPAL